MRPDARRNPMPATPPSEVVAVEFRDPKPKFTQDDVDRIVGERLARDREAREKERREVQTQYAGSGLVLGDARVTHEPRVYALDSQASYYSDVVLAAQPDNPGNAAARSRLGRYERELGVEMDRGTKEGRRAERIIRARLRTPDEAEHEQRASKLLNEIRGFGTDGGISATSPGEAAAFVSPAFLLDQWAPFRGAQRVFADQCAHLPLPAFGMKIYVPYFSTTDKVSEQTEGGAVTETEPATELEGSPTVATITGQITGTQQLHDRGGSGGGSTDVLIGRQLHEQLDEQVDKYVLNQAIKQGTAITGNAGAYENEKLLEDLAKARKEIADVAGTRLRATHVFSSTDFFGYYTRQFDSSKRPFMEPSFVPGFPVTSGADDFDAGKAPQWSRFLGAVMPGGVVWMADDSIPLVGTTTGIQILVSAPATAIILLEDDPVLSVFVETKADTLRTVLNLREYCAVVTRHAAGTAVLTGASYKNTLV